MKYLKRIIFVLILILTLASCKKKSDGEIKYKLYENVELGECDEFDVSYKIPSHQYVHITFTKNTPWIIYKLRIYEYLYRDNGSKYKCLTTVLAKTNIYEEDFEDKFTFWKLNNYDTYLENGDYYVDIYNDSKEELELGCDLINRKNYTDNNYYYDFNAYFSDIWNNLDRGEVLNYELYEPATVIKINTTFNHPGEKYLVKYSGDENVAMKILDSYGNEVGNSIIRDNDKKNYIYYACIYKTSNITEEANFSISVDHEEIHDGYEFEISTNVIDQTYNYNRFTFNCIETGKYDIASTNLNVQINIMNSNMQDYIYSLNNVSFEKGKKYYFLILNNSLTETQTGIINITKVE